MKKFFMLILTLCIIGISSTSFAKIPQSQIALGGITYGSSRAYVESVYGKPTSEENWSQNGQRLASVRYGEHLLVVYELSNNTVIDLACHESNNLSTPAGVTCGMELAVLRKTYGSADNIYSAHGGTIYVYIGDKSINGSKGVLEFDVRNNVIYQIEIW